MNYDQLLGIIRHVLTGVIVYAAAKGWIAPDVVPTELVAAIMVILGSVFSFLGKTNHATLNKAAEVPRAEQIDAGVVVEKVK